MGVDQLVTGGDFDDPVVDSLTSDSVNTNSASIAGRQVKPFDNFEISETFSGVTSKTIDGFSYETLIVNVAVNTPSGNVGLRVNGDTGQNYNWIRIDGGEVTNSTQIGFMGGDGGNCRASILLASQGDNITFDAVAAPSGSAGNLNSVDFIPNVGINGNISDPITQVTVVNRDGNNISGEIAVDGRDVQ